MTLSLFLDFDLYTNSLQFKSLVSMVFFNIFFTITYAHQGCIYNKGKKILWNSINI